MPDHTKQLEDIVAEYYKYLDQSQHDDASDVISSSKVQQMITRTLAAIESATGKNSVYFEQAKSVLSSKNHSWGHLAGLVGIAESAKLDIDSGYTASLEEQLHSEMRVFISHSSADLNTASALIDLLRTSLNLSADDIRCTSLDGYRLPGGIPTDEQLRLEVHGAEVFICLVSQRSMASVYVVFELGARWGANKRLIPLLTPGTPSSILGGPLKGINALSCDSRSQLHQLLAEIGEVLIITPDSVAAYEDKVEQVINSKGESERIIDSNLDSQTPKESEEAEEVILKDETKKILKLLFETDGLDPRVIAGETGLDVGVVQYHLDILNEKDFAVIGSYISGSELIGSEGSVEWVITSSGRRYVVEVMGI